MPNPTARVPKTTGQSGLTGEKNENNKPSGPSQVAVSPPVPPPGQLRVVKRNGSLVGYDATKIALAITKAFVAVEGQDMAASARVRDLVNNYTEQVTATFKRRIPSGGAVNIEEIQDQVELVLMRSGEHQVARSYVIYREKRAAQRDSSETRSDERTAGLWVRPTDGGAPVPLENTAFRALLAGVCRDLEGVDEARILGDVQRACYEGISEADFYTALVMSARALIEEDCDYSYVAARLLLNQLGIEVLRFLELLPAQASFPVSLHGQMADVYPLAFQACLTRGTELDLLSSELLEFDLERLGAALRPERDLQFTYLGLQTLYDRYFLSSQKTHFELPQVFFMRVAMGLSLGETDPNARALEFYEVLSSFHFMSSTPTLFNSGTSRPQMSSCYLSTVPDTLEGIFGAVHDNAMLSKWAGGLGNDWSRVRALGAHIKGTNGDSQGVVPFLKVVNDTAVAVNQGGKRKGAVCCYLETWHLDIDEFLELRKNTGDDRRRTHDMNTANWIPDLFMKRVEEDREWTLFSPDSVPGLHDLYGEEFANRYAQYEAQAAKGEISPSKRVRARDLWRRMLTLLFETGHPWITFKDPCNLRSPQQHVGVVHCSNLCTEITLNTSDDEIAVCNLGSVNLSAHIDEDGALDLDMLRGTVRTAIRMLDNVVDVNYYAVDKARDSNIRHRPIGLGLMGFQQALYQKRIPYASPEAVEFADFSMEIISYYALEASSDLAVERGVYSTYEGSLWSQGILPIDSLAILERERGAEHLEVDRTRRLPWDTLRSKIQAQGMRNSNVLAIAPTATIANVVGVTPSIEPQYQNLYVKSNLSGEFTVVNPYLERDLKKLGLWDSLMISDLKYYNGSLAPIERVPDALKSIYATAFEVAPKWIVDAASRRQKWIDQAQSLNLYIAERSGKKLDVLYRMAWRLGLKTTYYLRSLAATSTEKSTHAEGVLNAVELTAPAEQQPLACSIDDPECEACQ